MSRIVPDMATTKTRAEQETIIRRAADEKSWDVFSEDPKVVRKLTRLYGEGKPHGQGYRWLLPANGIAIRKPRVLTQEQRSELAERAMRNLG